MKVYASKECDNLVSLNVTVGKGYDVLEVIGDAAYQIVDDRGVKAQYHKDWFDPGLVLEGENKEDAKPIDAHYGFCYEFDKQDLDNGFVKLDPYFVAKQWGLGKRDDSGILFHCLKTIARFGDKNSREREIVALFKQVKRLAELEGVSLENV